MAVNDFETNLILRGKDLASQEINKVLETTAKLTATLKENIEQASKGEGSYNALKASLQDTSQGLEGLLKLQGRLEQFLSSTDKFDTLKTNLETARAEFEAYKASITDGNGKFNDSDAVLKKLKESVNAASTAVRNNKRSLDATTESFAKQGIEASRVVETLRQVEAEVKRVNAAYSQGRNSQADFSKNAALAREQAQVRIAAEKEAAAEAARLLDQERTKVLANIQSRKAAEDKARADRIERDRAEAEAEDAIYEREQRFKLDLLHEMAREEDAARAKAKGSNLNFNILNSAEAREAVASIRHITDQIANGASVTQALESHLGNFIQLGVSRLPTLLPFIAPIVAGFAAITVAVLAVNRAFEEDQATRHFQAQLDFMVDSLGTTGKALTDTVVKIEALGVSFKEARAVTQELLDKGFAPERILGFAAAMQKLADISGNSLTEETKKASEAFSGGTKEITEYLLQMHALTPALADEIRATAESNGLNAAREVAFKALTEAIGRTHDVIEPTTQATRYLSESWHEFLDYLSAVAVPALHVVEYAIGGILKGVNALIGGLREAIGLGGDAAAEAGKIQNVNDVHSKIKDTQGQLDALRSANDPSQDGKFDQLTNQLKALQEQERALQGQHDANTGLIAQSTTLSAAAHEKAREEQLATDEIRLRNARGAEAIAIEERILKAKREQFIESQKGLADQKDTIAAADARDARERERLDGLRLARGTPEDQKRAIDLLTAENDVKGAKGPQLAAAQKRLEDLKVEAERAKVIKDRTFDDDAQRERYLSEYRRSLIDADARKRENANASAGEKIRAQEDGLAKELLSIKAKLDNQDKTDLAARLRGIDEEYAKYELKIQEARRKGATNIPGVGSINDLEGELQVAKQREIDAAKVDSALKSIDAQKAASKAALADIGALAAKGGDALAQAVSKALEVTTRIAPAIRAAGQQALDTARAVNAANPTAQNAANVEKAESAVNDGDLAEQGVNALLKPATKAQKERDEIVAAERKLEQDGVQSATETQDRIKAAYDRTTATIQDGVAAVQKYLDTLLKTGQIGPAQFDLLSAKARELAANSNYVSDQEKQLSETITKSFQNEAVKAIDSAEAALGKFIAGHEKLGTAVKGVGLAFAQFAAGVLKDIGNMIIKQELLKALGFGGKGGAGGGDGSSGLGDLFGIGSGSAQHPGQNNSAPSSGGDSGGGGLFSAIGNFLGLGSSKSTNTTDNSATPASQSGTSASATDPGASTQSGSANPGAGFSLGQAGQLAGAASGLARAAGGGNGLAQAALGDVGKALQLGQAASKLFAPGGIFGPAAASGTAAAGTAATGTAATGAGTSLEALYATEAPAVAANQIAISGAYEGLTGTIAASGGVGDAAAAAATGAATESTGFLPWLAALFHEGGTVGFGNNFRPVDPSLFVNAPRYHSGGQVGLQPNEQAAILQNGETVMTKSQMRNMTAQPQQQQARSIRQVLVMDPKQVSQAVSGSHGEDVVLTHIKNNASQVRAMLK